MELKITVSISEEDFKKVMDVYFEHMARHVLPTMIARFVKEEPK